MGLGALIYQLQSKYRHGLKTAHYRDRVRWRILETRPIAGLEDGPCEIHVLTHKGDWLNLIWTLKSFYHHAQRRYPLCIHDDGTLDQDARSALTRHFPDARMISREQADATVLPTLTEFPRCREFRKTNHLSPKVFDFRHYLESDQMLLLDSDVLFYQSPDELLRRIEDDDFQLNSVNRDVETAYTVDPDDIEQRFGFRMVERFNSGLGVIQRDSLRLDWAEEFLNVPGIVGHFWRIEQTLFALLSCRHGVELLPEAYDVYLTRGLGARPSRHYVGSIRHLMYREGIARLVRDGMLDQLS